MQLLGAQLDVPFVLNWEKAQLALLYPRFLPVLSTKVQ